MRNRDISTPANWWQEQAQNLWNGLSSWAQTPSIETRLEKINYPSHCIPAHYTCPISLEVMEQPIHIIYSQYVVTLDQKSLHDYWNSSSNITKRTESGTTTKETVSNYGKNPLSHDNKLIIENISPAHYLKREILLFTKRQEEIHLQYSDQDRRTEQYEQQHELENRIAEDAYKISKLKGTIQYIKNQIKDLEKVSRNNTKPINTNDFEKLENQLAYNSIRLDIMLTVNPDKIRAVINELIDLNTSNATKEEEVKYACEKIDLLMLLEKNKKLKTIADIKKAIEQLKKQPLQNSLAQREIRRLKQEQHKAEHRKRTQNHSVTLAGMFQSRIQERPSDQRESISPSVVRTFTLEE